VPRLCELYPGICLTTKEKARKTLSQGSRRVPVGSSRFHNQTKRYATKYEARVRSVRQTQRNFAIFYFKPRNDSVTRIVMSIAFMFRYFNENSLLGRAQNAVPTDRFCSNYSSITNCTNHNGKSTYHQLRHSITLSSAHTVSLCVSYVSRRR
jgi:hypothetical protein